MRKYWLLPLLLLSSCGKTESIPQSESEGAEKRRQRIQCQIQHGDGRKHNLHQDSVNQPDPENPKLSIGDGYNADDGVKEIRRDPENLYVRHNAYFGKVSEESQEEENGVLPYETRMHVNHPPRMSYSQDPA